MTTFNEFIDQLQQEAIEEGPQAVEELELLDRHFQRAHEISTLRKARNLTQQQLSDLSGVPQSEISRLEKGECNPTERTLVALAKPLHAELRLVANDQINSSL